MEMFGYSEELPFGINRLRVPGCVVEDKSRMKGDYFPCNLNVLSLVIVLDQVLFLFWREKGRWDRYGSSFQGTTENKVEKF